jgi:hypothetical protein
MLLEWPHNLELRSRSILTTLEVSFTIIKFMYIEKVTGTIKISFDTWAGDFASTLSRSPQVKTNVNHFVLQSNQLLRRWKQIGATTFSTMTLNSMTLCGTTLKFKLFGMYLQRCILFETYEWAQWARMLHYTRIEGLAKENTQRIPTLKNENSRR